MLLRRSGYLHYPAGLSHLCQRDGQAGEADLDRLDDARHAEEGGDDGEHAGDEPVDNDHQGSEHDAQLGEDADQEGLCALVSLRNHPMQCAGIRTDAEDPDDGRHHGHDLEDDGEDGGGDSLHLGDGHGERGVDAGELRLDAGDEGDDGGQLGDDEAADGGAVLALLEAIDGGGWGRLAAVAFNRRGSD